MNYIVKYFIITSIILFGFSGCGKSAANITTLVPDIKINQTRSDSDRSIRDYRSKYRGSIIDALTHLDPPANGKIDSKRLENIVNMYKYENIEYIFVGPVPNEGYLISSFSNKDIGKQNRKELKELDNSKVRLYCGSEYTSNWLDDAFHNGYKKSELDQVLIKLENDLKDPDCTAMGEIGVYHFSKDGWQNVIEYAPTFEPFITIIERMVKADKWINLHIEPVTPSGTSYENSSFGAIAMLYKKFPNLKLILSHTAMTSSKNLRALFKKYPNLMTTFKPIRNHSKWRNLEPITNSKSRLYEDWAKLFEEMPERFLIGSDAKFGRNKEGTHNQAKYDKRIKKIRRILGSIDKEAAQKIAYENAKRIFELE